MSTQIIVPIADVAAVRLAILKELGARLGRPVATGGYTGMAGVDANGNLRPPGVGETLRAVDEKVSRDGTEVAFIVRQGGQPVLLRNRGGAAVLNPGTLANMTVQGQPIPATRVIDDETFFPDPPVEP